MDARDAHAKMLAEHHHFAFCEATIADVNVDWFTGQSIELHNGSTTKPQDFLHGHVRATEFDRHRQRQVEQHVDRNFCTTERRLDEIRQLRRLRRCRCGRLIGERLAGFCRLHARDERVDFSGMHVEDWSGVFDALCTESVIRTAR